MGKMPSMASMASMTSMASMASMASVEPAMESRWGGVGWGVSMKSMGSLRGGAPHAYAGGGGSGWGRAAALPPPGRSYHRFHTSMYPYIQISIFPYQYQSISIHIHSILIENQSNPIGINSKSIYFPCLGSIAGVIALGMQLSNACLLA